MSVYTGENVNDLSITTPTEGATPPSEVNNAIREIKDVIKNQWATIVKSAAYTLTPQDSLILVSGTTTITVPASTDISSSAFLKEYTIIKTDAAGTNVTIARTGSDTFNGATSITLSKQYEAAKILGSGVADWKYLPINTEITDATITTSNITTNNVSTSKHGFVPIAPNDTTKFLRGDATWATNAAIALGTRVAKTAGTNYAAVTDGFVTWNGIAYNAGDTVVLKSDGTATPTTIIININDSVSGDRIAFSMPIKAGQYYRIDLGGGMTTSYYWWTPLS